MKQIKYTGTADRRVISKADFDRSGVEEQFQVVWEGSGDVQEVNESAATLLETLDDFEVVQDESKAKGKT